MFVHAAELGALLLFAVIAPIALGDPQGFAERAKDNQLLAIAGGVGAGALIYVAGSAIWNTLFRYEHPWGAALLERPGYIRRLLLARFGGRPEVGRSPGETAYWRKELAGGFSDTARIARRITKDEGAVAELVTAYEFVAGENHAAPDNLVEWTSRRFGRFADQMNAGLAILIGVVASLFVPGPRGWSPWVETLLVALGLVTILYGWTQRREAEQMIELWLRQSGGYQEPQAGGVGGSPAATAQVTTARTSGGERAG